MEISSALAINSTPESTADLSSLLSLSSKPLWIVNFSRADIVNDDFDAGFIVYLARYLGRWYVFIEPAANIADIGLGRRGR